MGQAQSRCGSRLVSVIPQRSIADPWKCVNFLREFFGAQGLFNNDLPMHMSIGESLIIVGSAVERQPASSVPSMYVAATDRAFEKARSLGAMPMEQPREIPWGARRAMLEGPWGNRWQIATHGCFPGVA
ncbi:MAG: hypothetical protein WBV39_16115 [Rudaea sp.]